MKSKKSKLVIDNSSLVRISDAALLVAKKNKEKTGQPIGKYIEDAVLGNSKNDIGAAIDILRSNMEDKSEGSYYYSWQANIAMAYVDNENWYRNKTGKKVLSAKEKHEVANLAAKYFLDILIK